MKAADSSAPELVVVHPGVQHSGQLAAALHGAGRLRFLATRLQVGEDAGAGMSLLRSHLARRQVPDLPDSKIRRYGAFGEIIHRGATRAGFPRLARAANQSSARYFTARVLKAIPDEVRAVVGTDSASQELFTALAKKRPDVLRVLDISHPLDATVQALIRQDADKFGLTLKHYDDFHVGPPRRQLDEIELADAVLVASEFSAGTLRAAGVSTSRVFVVPYGLGEADRLAVNQPRNAPRSPLRLLSLGAMSERKGMTLLLRAMERLESRGVDVRLTIAGRRAGRYRLPERLPANTTYVGSPSLEGVIDLYLSHHVLVLPSMCEGFGRTLLESMAAGCAVITTERTGGPDILKRAPHAPLTIINSDDRAMLDTVIEDHVLHFDEYVRPSDARRAASIFSAANYVEGLVAAIDSCERSG